MRLFRAVQIRFATPSVLAIMQNDKFLMGTILVLRRTRTMLLVISSGVLELDTVTGTQQWSHRENVTRTIRATPIAPVKLF
jgi:hypothetical protein